MASYLEYRPKKVKNPPGISSRGDITEKKNEMETWQKNCGEKAK